MHPSIFEVLEEHFYFCAVRLVANFLNAYGTLGVVFLSAALISSVTLGHRLSKLCAPDNALLLHFPRMLGWLIDNSALILSATILTTLIAIHGLIPYFKSAYEQGALQEWWFYVESFRVSLIEGCIIGAVASYMGWYSIGRWLEPWCASKLQLATRMRNQTSPTDVRQLHSVLPKSRQFDPRKYFPKARKANSIFLGLDDKNAPVYLSRNKFKKTHGQFQGLTGSGKSVEASVILSQCVAYGDAVVVFDPKDDEWAPHVLRAACHEAGVAFHLINLRSATPQFDLFGSASSAQINELLIAGFGLSRTGGDSDFYRIHDRNAARILSHADNCKSCLAQMSDAATLILGDELAKSAKGLLGQLEELAELPVIQTNAGFDLTAIVRDGGCLYVVGSTANEAIITLQRMLFFRMMQIVETRTRTDQQRHVCIFLDEFKYMLSAPTLAALGTIRDKGANLLLAHQSLGDFADCGPTMPAASVRSVVVDNTGFKWLYRAKDPTTADYISGMTGKILTTQERYAVNRNDALAEVAESTRMLDQRERALIDVNMVQHLPDGCAVFISDGMARLAFASPILVQKHPLPTVQPAPIFPRNHAKNDPLAVDDAGELPFEEGRTDPFGGGAQ